MYLCNRYYYIVLDVILTLEGTFITHICTTFYSHNIQPQVEYKTKNTHSLCFPYTTYLHLFIVCGIHPNFDILTANEHKFQYMVFGTFYIMRKPQVLSNNNNTIVSCYYNYTIHIYIIYM